MGWDEIHIGIFLGLSLRSHLFQLFCNPTRDRSNIAIKPRESSQRASHALYDYLHQRIQPLHVQRGWKTCASNGAMVVQQTADQNSPTHNIIEYTRLKNLSALVHYRIGNVFTVIF